MTFLGSPNIYYYLTDKEIKYHKMTPQGTKIGIENHLPCGGFWLIGNGFAFNLEFGAGDYENFAKIIEIRKDRMTNFDKWYEFNKHLLKMSVKCWHTTKGRNEVANDLGLERINK